jgi:cytochrome b subunit of formate dehydrogenase
MEFLRRALNPWGEDVLVGLSWDVFWVVVVLGALFVVGHALISALSGKTGRATGEGRREAAAGPGDAEGPQTASGPGRMEGVGVAPAVPDRVERHGASARVSHWILALATFALLITAFVPILGLQFPWVTIHWIAGLVLAAYVVYHLVDTVKRGTLGTMWFGAEEMREGMARLRGFFQAGGGSESGGADRPGGGPEASGDGARGLAAASSEHASPPGSSSPRKPGKWAPENIAFHHATAVAGLVVVITGLLMMFRVDTWLWAANPYVLGISDGAWGWIYVLHGLASVGFVGLLMAHIYFALRPDKFWITRSMFTGWITREEYLRHHDPERWPASGEGPDPEADTGRRRVGEEPPRGTPSPSPAGEGAGD